MPSWLLLPSLARHELTVHIAPARPVELDALFWRVADPKSKDYANHQTTAGLRPLAGGTDADVDEISAWLLGLGASEVRLSPLGDSVTASFDEADKDPTRWTTRGLPHFKPSSAALVVRRDFSPPRREAPRSRSTVESPDFGPSVNAQKKAYGIPKDLAATDERTTQMVWGPGTFGYSPAQLRLFKLESGVPINLDKIHFDTSHHGQQGGDNFGEGSLDVRMISSFGLNATTLVSNTNTSTSTEEGDGFGLALLDFLTQLASRDTVPCAAPRLHLSTPLQPSAWRRLDSDQPIARASSAAPRFHHARTLTPPRSHVLSLSLGSLSPYSCDKLCDEAVKRPSSSFSLAECRAYLQTQRQVCMFESMSQVTLIDRALQALGLRGVTVVGSSGDGGSHWSFGPFEGFGAIPSALNKVGCEFQFPIYPSPSPYMLSIGGTAWEADDPSKPIAWSGSGGGFSWQCAAPAHQTKVVARYLAQTDGLPPAASFNASGRAYPDVSAISAEGTSESAPTLGGILTLVADARLRAGLPPLGFVGTRVYQVATEHPGEAFEDVTSGNSKTSCDNGFPATAGWDPVTGWGRVKWEGLLEHFGSAP